MTLVIAAQVGGAYVARMHAALLRFMMLVALAFMPLGMTGTPAVAATTFSTAAGHCDEHQQPADAPDTSLWNRRLIYTFDGGVQIGHRQGTPGGGSSLYDTGLSKGYAIAHSSGNRTSTHYNLVLGGETALMTKEEFIERYGVPLYTVGVGGSGGAIQQYVYGQNSRLLDAGIALARSGGPDAVVLREATRRAGVAPNAAYRHFDSRQALLQAVRAAALAALARAMEAELAALPQGLPPADLARASVRAVGTGYLRFAQAETGLFRTAFATSGSLQQDPPDPARAGACRWTEATLSPAARDRSAAVTSSSSAALSAVQSNGKPVTITSSPRPAASARCAAEGGGPSTASTGRCAMPVARSSE